VTPALVARLIEGARAGSLALTRTEAVALVREITPGAAVIVDGRPVDLRSIPWHVFPDHVAELPELDPWRRQAHESLVEGLIDAEDQRRLFEVADQREAEHRRQAEQIAGRFEIAPEALAELRRLFGKGDEHA
jgi:uncharacterized protein involved in exopolysaccharide biosynthesis